MKISPGEERRKCDDIYLEPRASVMDPADDEIGVMEVAAWR